MKKIGFTNFRRFTDFPSLTLGPITFLVGRNNSGKSTLVKAILLVYNYLKSGDGRQFSSNVSPLEDVNIFTFGRARNQNAESGEVIEFCCEFGNYHVLLQITGDADDTEPSIHKLLITDQQDGYFYEIQPYPKGISIGRNHIQTNPTPGEDFKLIDVQISEIRNRMVHSGLLKNQKDYIELVDKLNSLIDRKARYSSNIEGPTNVKSDKLSYSADLTPIDYYSTNIFEILPTIIDEIVNCYRSTLKENDWDVNDENDRELKGFFKTYKEAYDDRNKIEKSFNEFLKLVRQRVYIYLGANSVKQKALLDIKDKSNPLARAVHEYTQLGIESRKGDPAWAFTRKWIKEFEVGEDFKVTMHAGEAYELLVYSKGVEIPLADKGMGSVQAMLLILQMAAIIEKYGGRREQVCVVIEEPEINLHPALQSRLADLLLDVNQMKTRKTVDCDIEFIVETHSEYLIRRTQVLVVENDFSLEPNENPFCVYYFPKEQERSPYQLRYKADGTFDKSFGDGFFDEASSSTLELLKLKKRRTF